MRWHSNPALNAGSNFQLIGRSFVASVGRIGDLNFAALNRCRFGGANVADAGCGSVDRQRVGLTVQQPKIHHGFLI